MNLSNLDTAAIELIAVRENAIKEIEAVQAYDKFINHLPNTSQVKQGLINIRDEEKAHIGELYSLLQKTSPEDANLFQAGIDEAREIIASQQDNLIDICANYVLEQIKDYDNLTDDYINAITEEVLVSPTLFPMYIVLHENKRARKIAYSSATELALEEFDNLQGFTKTLIKEAAGDNTDIFFYNMMAAILSLADNDLIKDIISFAYDYIPSEELYVKDLSLFTSDIYRRLQ